MKVLVAYATRHGSTAGIAGRIAEVLTQEGTLGAFDPSPKPIGFGERVTRAMPAAQDLLPAGDFRDWDDIEAWAKEIAEELRGGAHPPNAS